MQVRDLLRRKGSDVATIDPDSTVDNAIATLAQHKIGAVVVSRDQQSVDGIVSERDIVRRLATEGAATLSLLAADIMTADVITCAPDDQVDALMATMTAGRFRHLPVTDDGTLCGIISIGDVVNARVQQLETQAEHLTNYITGY